MCLYLFTREEQISLLTETITEKSINELEAIQSRIKKVFAQLDSPSPSKNPLNLIKFHLHAAAKRFTAKELSGKEEKVNILTP